MDKVREEFEAWYSDKFKYSDNTLVKNDETYLSPFTDGLWSAWKASREYVVVELPNPCQGVYDLRSEGFNDCYGLVVDYLENQGVRYE